MYLSNRELLKPHGGLHYFLDNQRDDCLSKLSIESSRINAQSSKRFLKDLPKYYTVIGWLFYIRGIINSRVDLTIVISNQIFTVEWQMGYHYKLISFLYT